MSRSAISGVLAPGEKVSGKGLVYAGSVGTGFSSEDLAGIRARLEPLRRKVPPCRNAPAGIERTWLPDQGSNLGPAD